MAAITSLGVGSNLDLTTLLSTLSKAESQPLVAIQNEQASYTSKLSSYGVLQNSLASFQALATQLSDPALFKSTAAKSSASDVLSASAGSTAAAGSYSVNVTQLAGAQSLVTVGRASSTNAVGQGVVTIDFGSITGGTLDAGSGHYSGATFEVDTARTAQSITIDSSNDSLQGLRDAINKNSSMGVTASIVSDGSTAPNRLVLTSTATGAASSMRISVAGDASLSSLIGHDPAGSQGMQQTAIAANALLNVNGITVTSKSNVVGEAVQGVSMTLVKVGSSSVAVSADNSAAQSTVASFAYAFNNLQATIARLTKYDQASHTGADLVADSTTRKIQNSIRSAMNTAQPGTLGVLSKVGISFQKDGTLLFDVTKLTSALAANRNDVAELFSGPAGTTTGTLGFGKSISSLVGAITGVGGSLSTAKAGVNTSLKTLASRYTTMQVNVDAKVAAYRSQFTKLDVMMSSMNSTLSYLNSQFSPSVAAN
jgi:flagellar hook-associated protein 2